MLLYPLILAKINPQPTGPVLAPQHIQQQPVSNFTQDAPNHLAPMDEVSTQDTPTPKVTLPADVSYKSMINDRYILNIANIGAGIEKVEVINGKVPDIVLVDNAIYQAGILSIEGNGPLAGLSAQPYVINEDANSFSIQNNNLSIEKHIVFLKNQYAITADIKITNLSSVSQFLSFEITTGANISNKEIYESRYITLEVLSKDGKLTRLTGGKLKKDNKLYKDNIEWLALKNKYYSIIAKPDFVPAGMFTKTIDEASIVGLIVTDDKIVPGETKTYSLLLYIGPTEISELSKVEASFSKALNYGIFTSISLVLLSILKFFYSIFHNYGIAIILLTCCVSLLLYPLSFKSLKSMRKLQELQPHIEKVRSQHKDNPQKLNKEIMELYRRYNVNPMGGCFPMFLQMPIFIALYKTMMGSIELKGASFLWIKDLSMTDAAFRLPFTLPFLGNTINLLPILMIGAMILQQKISHVKTTAVQSEQQRMMGSIMPIMFGFIFYSLPSGLVLYWITNTVLTSSLQFFTLKKMEAR